MVLKEQEKFIVGDDVETDVKEPNEKAKKKKTSCCRKAIGAVVIVFLLLLILVGCRFAVRFFSSSGDDGHKVSAGDFMTPELMVEETAADISSTDAKSEDTEEISSDIDVEATTADPDDYWQYDEDEYEYADEYTESENENSNDKNSENPQESTKEELPEDLTFYLEPFADRIYLDKIFPVPVDELYDAIFGAQSTFFQTSLKAENAFDIHFGSWEDGQEQFTGQTVRKFDYKRHNSKIGKDVATNVQQVVYSGSVPSLKYTVDNFNTMSGGVPYEGYFYIIVRWQMVATTLEESHLRTSVNMKFTKEPFFLIKNKLETNIYGKMKDNITNLGEKLTAHFSS